MKLVLDQPYLSPFDPTVDVRVVVACEDSTNAVQACGVLECLEHLGRNCKPEGRLIYQWWYFEVLDNTALREIASREAAAADLIIVAAHEDRRLPGAVASWMTRWLDLRHGRPGGALVALLNSDLRTPSAPGEIFSQLKEVAARGHLDFFTGTNQQDKEDGGDARVVEAARNFVMTCLATGTTGHRSRHRGHLSQNNRAGYGCNN